MPYGAPVPYDVPVHQGLDDSTGTFTRVLLTGLGGEAELPPAPHQLAPPPAPTTAMQRAVAATRRLAGRISALRGDERTAMLAIGAVLGLVVLIIVAAVIVVRLTAEDPKTAAAPPPPPATSRPAKPSPTASATPAVPTGGQFTAQHTGYCLAVTADRTDEGAPLVQRPCGAGPAMTFRLVAKEGRDDAFSLVVVDTGKCVDVYGGSPADGVPAVQWTCHGGDNQLFVLRELPGTGFVQLVAEHSGKCLDVAGQSREDGGAIQQFECRDAATEAGFGNQSWKLNQT